MNRSDNSINPIEWFRFADKDWDRMKRMLEDEDAEAASFFLEQSLEKYLKAFLLKHGWKLKKIHLLYILLDDAVEYNPTLENFRSLCERVSGYYFTERYPSMGYIELNCEDIKKDSEEAKQFVIYLTESV